MYRVERTRLQRVLVITTAGLITTTRLLQEINTPTVFIATRYRNAVQNSLSSRATDVYKRQTYTRNEQNTPNDYY